MAAYNNYNQYSQVPNQVYYQQAMSNNLIYVHGRAGAEAYQLPYGVVRQVLWDDEENRFYVKAVDEMGRPRVVADNDFGPHVEEQKPTSTESGQVDLSIYPTKKDLEDFLGKYDTSKYLTKADLEKALDNLSLGAGGRIVRNEHDA